MDYPTSFDTTSNPTEQAQPSGPVPPAGLAFPPGPDGATPVAVGGAILPIDRGSVHRICSGQVVLSLATAVKELVENSLDAGATSIACSVCMLTEVRLRDSGAERIEVIDNGCGVSPNNFQALTLKHHTSKLSDFSDLSAVDTFGFRGEALSSLCALSKLSVTTCHVDNGVGSRLEFDVSGALTLVTACARQRGTTVYVDDLFHCLPVRHSELRRNLAREFQRLVHCLSAFCLVQTGVKISCTNQNAAGKRVSVLGVRGGASVRNNITDLYSIKQVQSLVEWRTVVPSAEVCAEYGVETRDRSSLGPRTGTNPAHGPEIGADPASAGPQTCADPGHQTLGRFSLSGYISSSEHGQGRSSTDRQFFYINGRPCDPTKVVRLVNETYRQFNRHQSPFVLLDVSVRRDGVDVNVTPDKRQILVNNERLLLATIKASLLSMFGSTQSLCPTSTISASQASPALRGGGAAVGGVDSHPPALTNKPSTRAGISGGLSPAVPDKHKTCLRLRSGGLGDLAVGRAGNEDRARGAQGQGGGNPDTPPRGMTSPGLGGLKRRFAHTPLNASDFVGAKHRRVADSAPSSSRSDDGDPVDPSSAHAASECVTQAPHSDTTSPHTRTSHTAATRPRPVYTSSDPSHNLELTSELPDDLPTCNINASHQQQGMVLSSNGAEDEKMIDRRQDENGRSLIESDSSSSATQHVELDSVLGGSRRSVLLPPLSLHALRHRLLVCRPSGHTGTQHSGPSGHTGRSFHASIQPTDNELAETELRKELRKETFSMMEVIGQFNRGFIVARLGRDLFIVDQHATDEKYNYELLQRSTRLHSQRLIQPIPLELTAANESVVTDNLHIFEQNGFEFCIDEQREAGQRVRLCSMPLSGNWTFGKSDVEEIIFILSESPGVMCRPSRVQQMLASRACRSSVMIGTALTHAEMRRLLTHMSEIDQPWNCPHGRPTIRHLVNLDLCATDTD